MNDLCRISMLCFKMPRRILRAFLRLCVVACSGHELSATGGVGSMKYLLVTASQLHLFDSDAFS